MDKMFSDVIEFPDDVHALKADIPRLERLPDPVVQLLYRRFSEECYAAGWIVRDEGTTGNFEVWFDEELAMYRTIIGFMDSAPDHDCRDPSGHSEHVWRPGEVFVFGSNQGGRHGAGAARHALDHHGAIWKCGEGPQGSSYAIPTKDYDISTCPPREVERAIGRFIEYAHRNPDLRFFVTRVGCGLAGYRDEQIAPMFAGAPMNCRLPPGWCEMHAVV